MTSYRVLVIKLIWAGMVMYTYWFYAHIYKECEFEGIYVILFLRKKILRKNL